METFILNSRIFYLILFMFANNVIAQQFSWVQGFTATGGSPSSYMLVGSTVVDTNNNIYSVGSFTGTVDFDQSANNYNLTSTNQFNMFLLKEDASGNFQWVKQFRNLK